jgi:hypothetical protein
MLKPVSRIIPKAMLIICPGALPKLNAVAMPRRKTMIFTASSAAVNFASLVLRA